MKMRCAASSAEYTREAGVRTLERQIGTIARKIAARVATDATYVGHVTANHVSDYLGPAGFRSEGSFRLSRPGVATGVAWTETGGDVLYIEAVLLPSGGGHLTLTGQLGSVMQESARAALSHVRQQAVALGINPDVLSKQDLHIHVPAGAIPEGRPVGGRDHGDGNRVCGARNFGPARRGDDRRDHALGPRPACRRHP